jgi:ankyrin repeat protein
MDRREETVKIPPTPNSRSEVDRHALLLLAVQHGDKRAVETLLANGDGIDLNLSDTQCGRTPLIWAALNGHKEIVELILAKDGVNPNSKDDRGWTSLVWAAIEGHKEIVEVLLAADGIDLNPVDNHFHRTPLLWAIMAGRQEIVNLLLMKDGVDPNSKDHEGWSPLQWAKLCEHRGIVEMLLARDDIKKPLIQSDTTS